MDHLSPDSFAHLVQSKTVRGRTLFVTFACSETGVCEVASAPLRSRESNEDGGTEPTTGLLGRLRHTLSSAVANSQEQPVGPSADPVLPFTVTELEAATYKAFVAARTHFRWSEAVGRWIGRKAPTSAFQRRLLEAPVATALDQMILVRTLLELAQSLSLIHI